MPSLCRRRCAAIAATMLSFVAGASAEEFKFFGFDHVTVFTTPDRFHGVAHTFLSFESDAGGAPFTNAPGDEVVLTDEAFVSLGLDLGNHLTTEKPRIVNLANDPSATTFFQSFGSSPRMLTWNDELGGAPRFQFFSDHVTTIVHAFGFYYYEPYATPLTQIRAWTLNGLILDIPIADVPNIMEASDGPGRFGYIGIVSDVPITAVEITREIFFDDVRFSAVPSPGAASILTLFIGAAAARRRRNM